MIFSIKYMLQFKNWAHFRMKTAYLPQIDKFVPFNHKKFLVQINVPFSIKSTLSKMSVWNVPFNLKNRGLNIYKKGTYNRNMRVNKPQ